MILLVLLYKKNHDLNILPFIVVIINKDNKISMLQKQ